MGRQVIIHNPHAFAKAQRRKLRQKDKENRSVAQNLQRHIEKQQGAVISAENAATLYRELLGYSELFHGISHGRCTNEQKFRHLIDALKELHKAGALDKYEDESRFVIALSVTQRTREPEKAGTMPETTLPDLCRTPTLFRHINKKGVLKELAHH